MPKLGQPPSLQSIATEALSVFVVCALPPKICDLISDPEVTETGKCKISSAESDSETEEDEDYDEEEEYNFDQRVKAVCSSLRIYLARSIPPPFQDAVCNALFARFRLVVSPMVGYLEYDGMSTEAKLFRATVRTFNTALSSLGQLSRIGAFGMPPVMQRLIKYPYLEYLCNLRVLDTRGWTEYCDDDQLDREIWSLGRLEEFIHRDCSTNRILHELASTCHRLHSLDVEGSDEVSDKSISILCGMRAMHTVKLGGTSVTRRGYFDLLLHMPQLRVLGAMNNPDIIWALDQVCQHRSADTPKLQLRKYCSGLDITSEQMESIVSHCPHLQHIALRAVWCDLRALVGLADLNTLELGQCSFESNYMCDLLKACGSKLSALTLSGLEELGMRDLLNVSKWCPNLQVLRIITYDIDEEMQDNIHCTDAEAAQMFQNVRELDLDTNVGLVLLEFLLVTCVHVEVIHIGVYEETLTDAFFEQVLTKNPMPRLRRMGIIAGNNRYTSNLSVVIARKLVENCNDFEQLLGKWEWLGSSAEVWAAYRDELRARNVDVSLFHNLNLYGVDPNRYFIY